MTGNRPLNEREERFVAACVAGLLPTAAARDAGYRPTRAHVTASEKMGDPRIRVAIEDGLRARRLDDASLANSFAAAASAAVASPNSKRLWRILELADSLPEHLTVRKRERLARSLSRHG
jgi:hypothetical protein